MKKIVLLSFVFLLVSTVVIIGFVRSAVAEETIYIRLDGTVEGTDKIQRDGNVYTFTDNIDDSIVIERNNIIINGDGYTVEGRYVSESKGIFLKLTSNVTIENVEVKKFYYGIRAIVSSDNIIQGNTITNNIYGIFLDTVFSNNRIQGNTIAENTEAGIWLDASLNSRFQGNTITNNYYGIRMDRSSNITITENNITSNEEGIRLLYSSKSSITNNTVANNENQGIELYYASNNSIHGNNITNNEVYGIRLRWSSDNAIYHNNFVGNTEQVQSENSTNTWDDGAGKGNYWDDYVGVDSDGDGIGDTPHGADNYPLVPYWVPPTISIISPENRTYNANNVSLAFRVSKKPPSWIGYGLDGQANLTITGNTTLHGLSEGSHSLTIYAEDSGGNIGASETITFSIAQETESTEPFPTWIVAAIVIIAVVGAALLVYFVKVRKTTEKVEK